MFDVLEKLNSTTKKTEQEAILRENDSQQLREYLDITLNTYRIYYVSKLPTAPVGNGEAAPLPSELEGFARFKFLIGLLERRQISGHLALNTIFEFFNGLSDQESKWYGKALAKKAIGVGVATVNKVYGNFIPTFDLMLSSSEKPDLTTLTYPLLAQPKLDGFRAVFVPGLGLLGRGGTPVANRRLQFHFASLYQDNNDFVFDGELYSTEISFNEISSILRSEDKPIPEHMHYHIFDGMHLSEWKIQRCGRPYVERYRNAEMRVYTKFNEENRLRMVPYKMVNSHIFAKLYYGECLEQGHEGLMLKDPSACYHWKRVRLSSGVMMKYKPEVTYDLEIIDVLPGKEGTKYESTTGDIVVNFNGVEVGVGSGLTDALRDEIWANKDAFIGQVVEIMAMEVTPDGSLRHPRFKRMRPDKS